MSEPFNKWQFSVMLGQYKEEQLVLRADSFKELQEMITECEGFLTFKKDEAESKRKAQQSVQAQGQPTYSKRTNSGYQNAPQAGSGDAGECAVHHVGMKLNKNGKPYHLNAQREFCNGRGFPSEKNY